MNWISDMYKIVTQGIPSKKYMSESNKPLYQQLNQELYRYIFNGSPIMMDAKMENYVTQAYTYNSLIYSIVNYRATTASSVGWKLIQRNGEETKEIFDHEFLDLWKSPNKDQTTSEFIEEMLVYKDITGNTIVYAPILQSGINKGKVGKFEVIPTHISTPIFGDEANVIKGWVINGHNWDREIMSDDVLHIKYMNPDVQNESKAVGMSPLKSLVTVITQNNDAWRSLASAFQNGGPAGFFSRDGATIDGEFTEEQGKQLLDKLRAQNSGPHRTNTLAATGGNVKYTPIGLSPVDLNILESIKLSFVQICNVFKFPAVLLNWGENSTYNNVLESEKILWTKSLKQDLKVIGQKITNRYLPAWGEGLELVPDFSNIEALQANKIEQVQWLSGAWWIKASRKQELMGEEVDDEMDRYFIPAGLIEMDMLPPIEDVDDNLKRLKINGY